MTTPRCNENQPLYQQIEEYIRKKIDDEEWKVGSQIPTEKQLCKMFLVSRITVIKALDRLVDEGVLVREQGKGTFVSRLDLSYKQKKLMSFTEEIKERGKNPSSIILNKVWKKPSINIRNRLDLSPPNEVWYLKRLMLEDNLPIGIQTSYLPVKYFPELITKINDNQSLYQLLHEDYSTNIDYAYEVYRAVQLDKEEMNLLDIEIDTAGFCVERLSYSNDVPVEFVLSIMRSDKALYTAKLVRE